jgi:hypothetical protein
MRPAPPGGRSRRPPEHRPGGGARRGEEHNTSCLLWRLNCPAPRLWCHEARCAAHVRDLGFVLDAGEPEVCDEHAPIVRHPGVLGLDVPVDPAGVVGHVQPERGLDEAPEPGLGIGCGQRVGHLPRVPAGQLRHRDEELPAPMKPDPVRRVRRSGWSRWATTRAAGA